MFDTVPVFATVLLLKLFLAEPLIEALDGTVEARSLSVDPTNLLALMFLDTVDSGSFSLLFVLGFIPESTAFNPDVVDVLDVLRDEFIVTAALELARLLDVLRLFEEMEDCALDLIFILFLVRPPSNLV